MMKLTMVSGVPMTAPNCHVIKMTHVSDRMMACPPIMLANKRTIKANGLVKMPKSSIMGIMGTGHLSHVGTGGQSISIQYSLLPKMLTRSKVQRAKTKVMLMLPVMLAPPGNIGSSPNKFVMNIKKNAVSRKGAYFCNVFANRRTY